MNMWASFNHTLIQSYSKGHNLALILGHIHRCVIVCFYFDLSPLYLLVFSLFSSLLIE
jgi:hypothetical protein